MIKTINDFRNRGPVIQNGFDSVTGPWKREDLQEMKYLSDQWFLEYVRPGPE
jgi:hypothetical protein